MPPFIILFEVTLELTAFILNLVELQHYAGDGGRSPHSFALKGVMGDLPAWSGTSHPSDPFRGRPKVPDSVEWGPEGRGSEVGRRLV